MPRKRFDKVLFSRVPDALHAAAEAEAIALGYSGTSDFVREVLRVRLTARLAKMAGASPAEISQQLAFAETQRFPLPPAPPQGGERPSGVQDGPAEPGRFDVGASPDLCPRCEMPLDSADHEQGCRGPATMRPPPSAVAKNRAKRRAHVPTSPGEALAIVKRKVASTKKKLAKRSQTLKPAKKKTASGIVGKRNTKKAAKRGKKGK